MASQKRLLHEALRERYLKMIINALTDRGEEVLRTGSQEICLPCVDDDGNDEFVVLTLKVPTGSRDGDAYDGYSMADDYALKVKTKAEKAEKAKTAKAQKVARDAAIREARAEAKAKRMGEG